MVLQTLSYYDNLGYGVWIMPNDVATQRVIQASAVLSEPLMEAFSTSVAHLESEASRYSQFRFPAIRPMLMRASVRLALEEGLLPEGARVGGNPHQNCELLIEYKNLTMRVLKENRRLFPGGIPVAGRNDARRAYYQQMSLEDMLFTGDSCEDAPLNLILLWEWIDVENRKQGVDLRLVHTIGAGRWSASPVPVDLSIPIVSDVGFYSNLEFETTEETQDFFATQIAAEENDSADAG